MSDSLSTVYCGALKKDYLTWGVTWSMIRLTGVWRGLICCLRVVLGSMACEKCGKCDQAEESRPVYWVDLCGLVRVCAGLERGARARDARAAGRRMSIDLVRGRTSACGRVRTHLAPPPYPPESGTEPFSLVLHPFVSSPAAYKSLFGK